MSQIQVTTLEANTLSAPSITAGQTTVNSTGLYLNSTSGVINTSAIVVANASGNVVLQGAMNLASITIGGTAYTSLIAETVNTQIFTSSNTWTKPGWATTGNELVVVHMWGGGGGGSSNNTTFFGGGGGAFVFGYYKASQLGATANVVVGVGGSANVNGDNSSFANSTGGLFTVFGGTAANATAIRTGFGGGWLGIANSTVGGAPLGGNSTIIDSTFGGGAGTFGGGSSVYGGGAGGAPSSPGFSIFGGGGGSSTNSGTSVYGGAGGNNTITAQIPGGGGSANASIGHSGARGEVRVYTYRILA